MLLVTIFVFVVTVLVGVTLAKINNWRASYDIIEDHSPPKNFQAILSSRNIRSQVILNVLSRKLDYFDFHGRIEFLFTRIKPRQRGPRVQSVQPRLRALDTSHQENPTIVATQDQANADCTSGCEKEFTRRCRLCGRRRGWWNKHPRLNAFREQSESSGPK